MKFLLIPIALCILILFFSYAKAQNSLQPVPKNNNIFIVPAVLFSLGAISAIPNVRMELQNGMFRTSTSIDDFLQFAPIAVMYGSYLFKKKHKHSIGTQSAYWGISQGFSLVMVHSLKFLTQVARPYGAVFNSFPSGHTANAFVNATVLYEEFKDHDKVMAYSGFVMASAVAALRVSNNEHWSPDVLVGAGLGILITRLVYRSGWFKK